MPDCPNVAFDICVLLRFAEPEVGQGDALLLGPDHWCGTDVLRAVVKPDHQGLAAPFDDLVQGSDDPLGRPREIDLDAKGFAVETVQHVQESDLPPIGQVICRGIH